MEQFLSHHSLNTKNLNQSFLINLFKEVSSIIPPPTSESATYSMPVSCSSPTTSFTTKTITPTSTQMISSKPSTVSSQLTSTPTSTCIYMKVTSSSPYVPGGPSTSVPSSLVTEVSRSFSTFESKRSEKCK